MRTNVSTWERFAADSSPLTTVKEISRALSRGPGVAALYKELREHGTVLGVRPLSIGKCNYFSRRAVVAVVEGRDGQTEA